MRGVLARVSSSMLAHRRGRIFVEEVGRPDRPRLEIAAAVRAGARQRAVDAVGAEGALEGADAGVGGSGREITAAAFAVGAEFEHFASSVCGADLSSTRYDPSPCAACAALSL